MSRKSVRTLLIVLTFAVPLFPVGLGLLGGDADSGALAIEWAAGNTAVIEDAAAR